MNIKKGFQIDKPNIFVSWDISEADLMAKLCDFGLKNNNNGYYYLMCTSLGGLEHELGFCFNVENPQADKKLEQFISTIGTVKRKITAPQFRKRMGKLVQLDFRVVGTDLQTSFV